MTADLESNLIPEEVKKLLDEGHWQEAVGALDHALEAHPDDMILWREKANTLLAMNQSKNALDCYNHMLRIDPGNPSIYSEKAAVLETVDGEEEALVCYDHALAINGSDVTALAGKARLLTRKQRIPEAMAVYDLLLRLKPQDPEILIAKGDALVTAGQTDQAASCFEQAAAIKPTSFGAAEWTMRGDTLSRNKQPDNALRFYDRAIVADPRYVWAYQGKALVLKDTPEKTDDALQCLQTAMDLDQKSANLPIEIGNIHYYKNEYKKASSFYSKAIELDPNSEAAWENLGLTQEALEDYAGAAVSAEKRLALDPSSTDGWLHKGFCLNQLKRLDESTASYQKALELDPKNFWANNNIGWNLTQMKKYEEALPFYEKAIEVNPNDGVPWANKAFNLRELGRYHEALEALIRAAEVVQDKQYILAGIGYIYSDCLFDHAKALEFYKQSLQLDPSNIRRRLDVAECLIKIGRYTEGRAEAEKLVGQLNDPELECALSLVILAAYALEGDAAARARQFDVVLEQLNLCFPEGKPLEQTRWSFAGLLNTIRASSIPAEAKFLVSTIIDVQQGSLVRSALSFFNSGKQQTGKASADAPAKTGRDSAR